MILLGEGSRVKGEGRSSIIDVEKIDPFTLHPSPFTKARVVRRGQSTLEWALLMAIMLAALLGAQRFLKASLMGQWRTTVDTFGHGRQYEPGRTTF